MAAAVSCAETAAEGGRCAEGGDETGGQVDKHRRGRGSRGNRQECQFWERKAELMIIGNNNRK